MDINFTKHNITTEEILYKATLEIPTENNIILGGNDMKRLIKSCFMPSITSKSINDRALTVEGTVTANFIYIDDDNCLCSHEHTFPFSKTVEADKSLVGGSIFAEICDRRITASQSGDNRIIVSGNVSVAVKVIRPLEQEIICDIDDRDIEKLCENAEMVVPMGYGEKNLICEEEVSVGNGQPSVKCIIRNNATANIDETKIIAGKVMVKGTVRIYVLYLPDEGTRPQSFEESFPFSQLVDVAGINEDCKCESSVDILFCELKPHMGDGDIRSFSASMKLCVKARGYCDQQLPVVLDAYSTKNNCSAAHKEMSLKKISETVSDRFIAKKTLEFTDGAIGSVIDVWCESKNSSSRFDDGMLKISGSMLVNLLAYDCDGVPNCYERPIDFEYAYKCENDICCPEAVYCINVIHCSYTILGANTVAVSLEISVCATVYDNVKHRLLAEMVPTQEGDVIKGHDSSIVLYFADAGERVWDIARRYNSSVGEIKTLNGIDEEKLSVPAKIIIPTK